MPLWLNYGYQNIGDSRLLQNYIYLLNKDEDVSIKDDEEHICRHIDDGKLLNMLESPETLPRFEDPVLQDILLAAYPYEVLMKFKWQDVQNNVQTNQQLIWYFNQFFKIDYMAELDTYCNECNRDALQQTFLTHEKWRYKDVQKATWLFFDFVYALFDEQGYDDEIAGLQQFVKNNLIVTYTPGISGNTDPSGDTVVVEVGNNTYTTLFHELVHATNRYFRFDYFEWNEHIVCYDKMTQTNEGLSNFVAYHLMDGMIAQDLSSVDQLDAEPIFFSMYIDIYATLREFGSNDRHHNYDLVHQQLKKFEWDLLTDDKARFYYERFYKFFHYDQHEYFYPKEMMYYLGYHKTVDMFAASDHKRQLLASCLLGKICL